MANLNKIMLIGRLGKDPECRQFANGGKVASFSICVNDRKKNSSTGQWEDDPVWFECSAFNSTGDHGQKLADLAEQYLRKGHQVYVEGKMILERWEDKNGGGKREKFKVRVFHMQFLEPKPKDGQEQQQQRRSEPTRDTNQDNDPPPPQRERGGEEEIPF